MKVKIFKTVGVSDILDRIYCRKKTEMQTQGNDLMFSKICRLEFKYYLESNKIERRIEK